MEPLALASLMVLILIIAVCSVIFSRITDSEEVLPETYTVASEPALSETEPVEDSSSFRITFLNVDRETRRWSSVTAAPCWWMAGVRFSPGRYILC